MEHQFYIDRLSAYFDNELKNEELVIVKEHVEGCEECQKRLHELEKLEDLISENSELSESDYWEQSAQKIESALSSQTEATIIPVGKSSKSSLWWKLIGVAASLVLVALFAFEQKDSNDELLRQEAPKISIKHVGGAKVPIIKDTIIDDKVSVGRSAEQSEEPLAVSNEVVDNAEQNTSEQIVENLQTKPKKAPVPQPIKKSDKVLLEKNKVETKKTLTIKEQQSSNKEKRSKTVEIFSDKEPNLKYGADIGKTIKSRRAAFKAGLEKSKTKKKYKASSSLSALSQKSEKTNPQELKVPEYADKTEINYWRRKVSLCTEQLQSRKNKKILYLKKAATDSAKVNKGNMIFDKDFLSLQLFEAYYKIAVMTTDTTEEKQAVQFLKENADSLNSSKSAQALHFLEKYKSEKNRQKSSKSKTEE